MKRFVVVGTGGRGTFSFIKPIHEELGSDCEIAGIYDPNPKRLDACQELLEMQLPTFHDFAEMVDTVKPDGVIVTSVDATHAEYVVKALEAGIGAFSEKPLCTSVDQVQAIRRAAKNSTAEGFVTHNQRYNPDMEIIKQHILDGAVGDVLSIQFTETLDRYHGADYFRRWHGRMDKSAGLLVHKSSHHFDIINWLAASRPRIVTAQGRLSFYGEKGPFRGPRCSDCPHADACWFHADVFKDKRMDVMYRQAESEDGYWRDGCVFDPRIDIYDTMSVSVSYDNDVIAGYNLIAYASYESMRVAVEGTRGRLELYHTYGTSWAVGHDTESTTDSIANDGDDIRDRKEVYYYDSESESIRNVTAPVVSGGHGGADPKLRRMLFGTGEMADPLNQRAPLEEGIQAVLVGLAANKSIAQNGQPVDIPVMAPPV